ncbi:uncharacterized protein TRAVEDRAFT_133239, partial [Trametes versicolor FP-101664 SS1]|uniref:uncharacterized protein n=1 Tax=Trametes versicolor (strain FP-101664) TaxID=717944 RepID=UPI0004621436
MPRFLNTTSGEFEWHNDPSQVSYAIISHTWRPEDAGGEQSYEDIRKLQTAVQQLRREAQASTTSSSHPAPIIIDTLQTIFTHPDLSEKIKGVCKIARQAGYELLWLDSCCIDKTSSAELSEAINSMFEWYRLADVCYVYLEDVHEGDNLMDDRSEFSQSRWHKRGWTLQELIAPERVVFLSVSWSYLGTRMGLASTLAQITGIDFDILTGRATMHSASVARRMAWAAKRETTRVEDRAYCLMGIFNIHMSPIYGEGLNAFLRLQEAIIRTIPDQSVFTW